MSHCGEVGGLGVGFPVGIECLNSPISNVAWIHLLQHRETPGLIWLEAKVRKLLRKLPSDLAWRSAVLYELTILQ